VNGDVFAIHITWTCYGTWLPGDPRGYVSNTLGAGSRYRPKQNIAGTEFTKDDRRTYEMAKWSQKGETVFLKSAQAETVCHSLVKAASERHWRILRASVMRNHVHIVIMDCPSDGTLVRRILKGVTQADLCDKAGRNQRWWTAGGSDRHKNDDDAVLAAIQYVADQRGILAEIIDMVVHTRDKKGMPPG
jgi:REP element-mobilizing transposase RayT